MTDPQKELPAMLSNLSPRLNVGEFIFLTLKMPLPEHVRPLAAFHEWEGESVVLRVEQADTIGLKHSDDSYAWLTLGVNSALDSVGLTAAVTSALAEEGIPCNVIAAYHHDHLFVPYARRQQALEVLQKLQSKVNSNF